MTQQQFNFLFNKAGELMLKTKDPVHDWSHIERVLNNALKIKNLLPINKQLEVDDKILILAVTWHDISYAFYAAGFNQFFLENRRARRIACHYFREAQLPQNEVDLLGDIIFHHVWQAFHLLNRKRSYYHQIVQDADSLDSFAFQPRVEQARHAAQNLFYYKFMTKILKPLFYNWLTRHPKFIYNLPEIIKKI